MEGLSADDSLDAEEGLPESEFADGDAGANDDYDHGFERDKDSG